MADTKASAFTAAAALGTGDGFPVVQGGANKLATGTQVQTFTNTTDATLTTTDVTTNDVSTSKHGFCPKAPNSTSKYLRGDATWSNIGTPVYARLTGTQTTTGQALADISGLSIACEASAVYELTVSLLTGTSAVTTGTKYGVQYSAAGAAVNAGYNGTTTDTSNVTNRMTALNTGTSTFMTTSGSTNGSFFLTGIFTTGANTGNVTVQHLKVTSGTSSVFAGSYMKLTRIA